MFDFVISEPSLGTAIYCLLMYIAILLLLYKKVLKKPFLSRLNQSYRLTCYIFILLFILTHLMQGDFFHLMRIVQDYDFTPGAYNYGEKVYGWITRLVNRNYLLFRFFVWGLAYLLFYLTSKRFGISPIYTIAVLFATHVITFSYARVSLAMALFFYGASFLCKPAKNHFLGYLLGVLLILTSRYFHNSAVIMIVMISMLIVPLKKWSFILAFLLIAVFSYILRDYFSIYASTLDDSIISAKIYAYSDQKVEGGLASQILNLLEYSSFLLPFFICILHAFKKNNIQRMPISILRLMKITFGLVLVAFVFLMFGPGYRTFFYRILFMTMIPLAIMVPILYNKGIISYSNYMICLFSGILFSFTRYLYEVYVYMLV